MCVAERVSDKLSCFKQFVVWFKTSTLSGLALKMMRRSRISIKPNFKPGSRTGPEGDQASQTGNVAGDALKTEPTQSQQQNATCKELCEDVRWKETPEMPLKVNQNNGAPSSGSASSTTAPQRRMRISAAPKLARPKLSSTSRSQTSAQPSGSGLSALPNEKQIHDSSSEARASVSVNSNSLLEPGTPRKSTLAPEHSFIMNQSSSPCVPSTSGFGESLLSGKNAVEDSPPSPQPGQVPQQAPQEPEVSECPSTSDLPSADTKLCTTEKTGSAEMSEKSSDKDRILQALKLKELMKIERRKDIQKGKRRVHHKVHTAMDRSKMTMGDLLYYLPSTSPMRSSVVSENNPEETIIPPSPKEQIKTAERDDDEEEEEESDKEEMLMPRVRVAEDGSIILDEDSLTVRVQRTSDTKVVENSALFERGSMTNYSSFRKLNYVKTWSVRETDLFFLAISMVGTDFSLVGQLLTNRSRAAIKSKFKKEERVNPWRVDKALRNKRPFDREFFSYLLEKVLEKDKDKRKSIRLVLPKTRKPRRSKGKTSNKAIASDAEEEDADINCLMSDEDLTDVGAISVKTASGAGSNVKEDNTPVPAKRRRKGKDEGSSSEGQVKGKRQRKCRKKTKEVQSVEDSEAERNIDNDEEELERSTSSSKRRRKHSPGDEGKQKEKPVKERKGKRTNKSLKESVSQHDESGVAGDEEPATKTKRKRAQNSGASPSDPVTRKKNPKRKKALKSTVSEEGTAGDASADMQDAEQVNTSITAEVGNNVSPKTTGRSKKPSPKLARTRSKKRKELEVENQDEDNRESILTAANSPLEDERLQMQAVVVLEKTPPRQQYLLSPSKVKCKDNELEPAVSSPSGTESYSTRQTRRQRAGRVKRDLCSSQETERQTRSTDQEELLSQNPMGLFETITRESDDEEDDRSLNENLIDLSCLRDFDSQVFQRQPMVVLSREEVDMILNTSEQSAEENPSVSPLDLSLNTELSFSLHCSRLLEDNDEAVGGIVAENENSTNEGASCEARNTEELMLTDSALVQPDIFLLRNKSAQKPEVCSHSEVGLSEATPSCSTDDAESKPHPATHNDVTMVTEVLKASSPLVLENADPICMKVEAPRTQETVGTEALGTLVVSDLMEESQKAMLPSLPKEESVLASAEISAQSELTSVGSSLESLSPLKAADDVKAELQTSPKVSTQASDTLQDSDIKEDTQEAAMGSPEVGLDVTENSQEVASVRFSGASISSDHGIGTTRRSRLLKPKPILSQKTRATVLQNQREHLRKPCALKPNSNKSTGSSENLHCSPLRYSAAERHDENFSKQNLTKETTTSQSNTSDQTDSESTAGTEVTVPGQENITTATLSPSSAAEPQRVPERISSRSDVDMKPSCTLSSSPQPLQNIEATGSGQMIAPSQDVCAPAELVHLTEDGHHDEEPTFILTLYEIPVTEAYLPSSSNDPAMICDLSDQAHSLPSTLDSYRTDLPLQSQNDSGVVIKNMTEYLTASHTKDEDRDSQFHSFRSISAADPQSECTKRSESVPLDLTPSTDNSASGFSVSKRITTFPQESEDTEQRESAGSHMLLDDVFVPVSEEAGDDLSKDKAIIAECKLKSSEVSSVSIAEDLAKSDEEQISKYPSSHESIVPDTTNEKAEACGNLETAVLIKDPESECKNESDFAPLEDLPSRAQRTSSGPMISECITIHEDEDTEQCEAVSHILLGDVFIPVSEKSGDDLSKDEAMSVECKLENSEACTVSASEENVKAQISKDLTSQDPVIPYTKDEQSDAGEKVPSNLPHLDPHWRTLENVSSSTPSRCDVSKCITLHQGSDDTNGVSHVLLSDVFVPVSEELEGDSSRTTATECKRVSILSLPDIQDPPLEELTKVENSPVVSNLLSCFDSNEDLSKSPAKRRERRKAKPQPKLVKRAQRAKADSSKDDEGVKGPNQPTISHSTFSASNEQNLPGSSSTTTKASEDKMSSPRGNRTTASKGQEGKTKSIAEKSPKSSCHKAVAANPISSAVHLSKGPKLDGESSESVMRDDTDTTASAEEKRSPTSTPGERAKAQGTNFNLLKSPSSGSSTVDSAETRPVFPEAFVLVSDVMKDNSSNDWKVSARNSPQRVPEKTGARFERELQAKEESTQTQSPLRKTLTPARKRAVKQEVKIDAENGARPSAQPPALPQNDQALLLEEKLQNQHHIMPCTVKLLSLDTVDQSLNAAQVGVSTIIDKSKGMSPTTSRVNVMTVSGESYTPVLPEEVTMEEAECEKKSPRRKEGKQTESSPKTKRCLLKPAQIDSQARQLSITHWVKKRSCKTPTNQPEKQPAESSEKQSSSKDKEEPQPTAEPTCSKSQHADLQEPEGSCLVPTLEKTKEANQVSVEVKKSPARQRAKLQVMPILAKRACTKGKTPITNQPPTQFTSPTRQHARASRDMEESDNRNNQPIKEVSNTSSIKETQPVTLGPQSPKSQDVWPKVVLPRVNLESVKAGICSASSTPTSSPARVSRSDAPPMTPPQLKKSLTQSSSTSADENPDDDPSSISQFFLCDIFTEVEEAE